MVLRPVAIVNHWGFFLFRCLQWLNEFVKSLVMNNNLATEFFLFVQYPNKILWARLSPYWKISHPADISLCGKSNCDIIPCHEIWPRPILNRITKEKEGTTQSMFVSLLDFFFFKSCKSIPFPMKWWIDLLELNETCEQSKEKKTYLCYYVFCAVVVDIKDVTTTETAVWAVHFVESIRLGRHRRAKPAGPERPARKGDESGGKEERGNH